MIKTVHKPTIKRRDMDAVLRCLVDEAVGPGECADSLVKDMAEAVGVAGGVALREYRRALELAFATLGLQAGDRVLMSALAPAVYLRTVEERGLTPVFADVDRDTGTLPAAAVAEAVNSDVRAVVVDAPLGIPPAGDVMAQDAVPVIEDLSYSYRPPGEDESVGGRGRVVVLHLEHDGVITGGGGAVVMARSKRDLRQLRNAAEPHGRMAVLGNLNASLAHMQFRHRDEFVTKRRIIAEAYGKALAAGKHSAPSMVDPEAGPHAMFPVILHGSRRDAEKYARTKGVSTGRPFEESVIETPDFDAGAYPQAAALAMRTLLFPLYPLLRREDVERVTRVLATLP